MIRLNFSRAALILLFFSLLMTATVIAEEPGFVYIYDDISDTYFGRSAMRSVVRGVRIDRFNLYRTFEVDRSDLEVGGSVGFLTPLVFEEAKKVRLDRGEFPQISRVGGIYTFKQDGIDFSFSLEKPPERMLREIDDYYQKWPEWAEPVRNRYQKNWVIRIHRAENVFDEWVDQITYNEALLSASIIADRDQWLWGVKDGFDILLTPSRD